MQPSIEERDRILGMIEAGQLTASQAARLLDALVVEPGVLASAPKNHTLRIWVTDLGTRKRSVTMTATLPIAMVGILARLVAKALPQLSEGRMQEILRAIESGATGRLIDLQDLEDGKRIEIFVEH